VNKPFVVYYVITGVSEWKQFVEADALLRNPLPFPKCANGTLLPLTLGGPSVTMRLGKSFTTLAEGGTD